MQPTASAIAATDYINSENGLKPSKALSMALNPPSTFAGRKVGVLVTDGVDRSLLEALRKQLEAERVTLEIVAPTIGGVEASDGTRISANQTLGGAPSVLYDAVAVLPSKEGAELLLKSAAARDFVSDAFVHLKFIAWSTSAMPLLESAGIAQDLDVGCIEFTGSNSAVEFVAACRKLRRWEREGLLTA